MKIAKNRLFITVNFVLKITFFMIILRADIAFEHQFSILYFKTCLWLNRWPFITFKTLMDPIHTHKALSISLSFNFFRVTNRFITQLFLNLNYVFFDYFINALLVIGAVTMTYAKKSWLLSFTQPANIFFLFYFQRFGFLKIWIWIVNIFIFYWILMVCLLLWVFLSGFFLI